MIVHWVRTDSAGRLQKVSRLIFFGVANVGETESTNESQLIDLLKLAERASDEALILGLLDTLRDKYPKTVDKWKDKP